MTSKQALTIIKASNDLIKVAFNKVEKDLDKLTEITKILTDLIQYDKDGWLDEENIGPYLVKIEEWLENE